MAPLNERTAVAKPKNLYDLLRLMPMDFGGVFSKILDFLQFDEAGVNALRSLQ